jgi:hypothetical protein
VEDIALAPALENGLLEVREVLSGVNWGIGHGVRRF